MTHAQESDVHFTVFIRLPFPRGDFVDPPPVEWSAAKDRALWDILSRPSKGDDIDWKGLAENFDVTLQFLLQQAAWLYDRQLSQVRAQMRRVGNHHSNLPSPATGSVSGSTALGGQNIKMAGSGGTRGPSKLSTAQKEALQKENLPARVESAPTPSTKPKGPPARTSSATTVTLAKARRESSPLEIQAPASKERDMISRGPPVNKWERPSLAVLQKSPRFEDDDLPLSSSDELESDSDDEVPSRGIPGFKRFGKLSMHRPSMKDKEDDEEDSPAFLPLPRDATPPTSADRGQNPGATVLSRAEYGESPDTTNDVPFSRRLIPSASLTSSSSSGVAAGASRTEGRRPDRQAGTSGAEGAGLASQSPQQAGSGKESSEETPSMGSSFSDLDDASVTQSALEEAFLSRMQHGGMASRMSTISQALRSRYL